MPKLLKKSSGIMHVRTRIPVFDLDTALTGLFARTKPNQPGLQ